MLPPRDRSGGIYTQYMFRYLAVKVDVPGPPSVFLPPERHNIIPWDQNIKANRKEIIKSDSRSWCTTKFKKKM